MARLLFVSLMEQRGQAIGNVVPIGRGTDCGRFGSNVLLRFGSHALPFRFCRFLGFAFRLFTLGDGLWRVLGRVLGVHFRLACRFLGRRPN